MLRRVLNLVFSRIVVTGVLLLLQAFWLFALFYWLADYAKWFGGVGVAMSIIMCLALIRQDSTVPEFKISWMILFAVMPVQGGILYLLWGTGWSAPRTQWPRRGRTTPTPRRPCSGRTPAPR